MVRQVSSFRFLQLPKGLDTSTSVLGRVAEVSPEHEPKQLEFIRFTPSGRVMVVREVQLQKAS